MKPSLTVTESELLDALAAAQLGAAPDDARTMLELAEMAGASWHQTRNAIVKLTKEGRVRVHRVQRLAVDGRLRRVPAYTILPAA